MKKRIVHGSIRFVVILVIALTLEIFIINFRYFADAADKLPGAVYDADQIQMINWLQSNDGYISLHDPQMIVMSVDLYVRSVYLEFESNRPIPDLTVYYTNEQHPDVTQDTILSVKGPFQSTARFDVLQPVRDIRIDPGEDPGLQLSRVQIAFNSPLELDISLSRIIAVLLIYYIAKKLFSLQKIINYADL